MENSNSNKVSVIIVGAGPAGLSAAINIKKQKPQLDVCVIDKSAKAGNHNLSGAAFEAESLENLLNQVDPQWQQSEQAKEVLARKVDNDAVYMFLGKKGIKIPLTPFIKLSKAFGLGLGQMVHHGDYLVSISKLTKWLNDIAISIGVEVLYGFSAEDIELDADGKAVAVVLKEQGLDKHNNQQPNYVPAEKIYADYVVLAEGCDGLVSEKFIQKNSLARKTAPLYSVGIKEIIKVADSQYAEFGDGTCIHAMGYPLWRPLLGPGMFGGGFMYSMGENKIAVGIIVGADWKYHNFNPQDGLVNFKNIPFVKKFVGDGQIVEAGAKMIPEGGFYAIPRSKEQNSIGYKNTVILGDSAGFVNMLKIKGLHNAIESGIIAAKAIVENEPENAAAAYTLAIDSGNIYREMNSSRNFRQTFAKLGATLGMPFSIIANLLPKWHIEPDYMAMKSLKYPFKSNKEFDKDTFTALAATEHREEQPCHLNIINPWICHNKCKPAFQRPCITFCPAGVYEAINDKLKAANPSNCLHCKTCQRKCPFDNIRWTVPEGNGGPRYLNM